MTGTTLLIVVGLVIAWAVVAGLTTTIREAPANKKRAAELAERTKELTARSAALDARDTAFKKGYVEGRKWLAEYIADAESAVDVARADYLRTKPHRGLKAAAIVTEVKKEKRELKARIKYSEYQVKSYEEYFPFLEEYRDLILDERIPLSGGDRDNEAELEAADPTLLYLSREEYEKLSPTERNQVALDRYIARDKSSWEIGRLYERYIGYLRESAGWAVEYVGAIKGYEDLGRDLICTREQTSEIVQAKCWSRNKIIREKHIFQLYGTTFHYRNAHPTESVDAVFVTTTFLSDVAKEIADALSIRIETVGLPKMWAMIKCNVNSATKQRIYHLPFDQQYDHTRICNPGECFVVTVAEAEALGFRRAWRWRGKTDVSQSLP